MSIKTENSLAAIVSPFERHGVRHLSASSANKFADSQALWVLNYLYKVWGAASPAMERGKAVEHGVSLALFDPAASLDAVTSEALALYDKAVRGMAADKVAKERLAIAPMIGHAVRELCQYGVPTAVGEGDPGFDKGQHEIRRVLEGVSVPFVGYLDFRWDDHGIICDLKTTQRMPSVIGDAHARQFALYAEATNYEVRGVYVTPRECRVYRLEDQKRHVGALARIGMAMEAFLAAAPDRDAAARMCVPSYDGYLWDDPAIRAGAREVFGF